ncbi:LEA type 2 family protein [Geoalkalibacter sp.]|uniref:LEA type 2 family protein n=1 Tax=Geoalkalibacter sp. TaxID=3041440 RepID=UPI00272E2720|nr:LEA type 2 family protein [Geoalkalibacter sp.]
MPAPLRILLILMFLLVGGCATLRPEPPEVSLVGLQVQELTLSHVNMLAELSLFNPNRIGLNIEQVDYALSLNGIRVSSGKSLAPVKVAAGESANVTLRLSGSYLKILQLLNTLQKGDELKYLLDGAIKVGGLGVLGRTFPLREEGMISAEVLRGVAKP